MMEAKPISQATVTGSRPLLPSVAYIFPLVIGILQAQADNWSTGITGQITSGASTNVGIGNTISSSSARLSVDQNANTNEQILNLFANSKKMFAFEGADQGLGGYFALFQRDIVQPTIVFDARMNNKNSYVNTAGFFGIGTSAPQSLLHVKRDGTQSNLVLIQGNAGGNATLKALTLSNGNTPGSGNLGQAVDQDFSMEGPGSVQYTAARFHVGKESDWTNVMSNVDAYFAISTTLDGQVTERMRISSNGDTKIRGGLVLEGESQVFGNNYNSSYNDFFRIFMDGQTNDRGALHIRTGDNSDEPIYFEQGSDPSPGASSNIRMAIASNGYVGIGIGSASPQANLEVGGDAILGNLKSGNTTGAPMAGAYIGYKGTPELSYTGFAVAQFANGTTAINAPANGRINIGIGGLANGISIDATNGVQAVGDLKVNGTLRVGTVLATNWQLGQVPDYVFEKDYKLASLDHVERFIEKNKHLPDIPSAKEVKEKGLDLGEMNMKLLRKVEELTLYSIRQQKEIAGLKERLDRFESMKRNRE